MPIFPLTLLWDVLVATEWVEAAPTLSTPIGFNLIPVGVLGIVWLHLSGSLSLPNYIWGG